jgi:protein gp37
VFCASLADVFDNAVDPAWRADLFKLISETPDLDWLLLTKRIGNAGAYLDDAMAALSCRMPSWAHAPWPKVWIGATIVNQEEADRDIPKLLATPAAKRFLSIEPLLGPVTFRWAQWVDHQAVSRRDGHVGHLEGLRRIDWVIVGGESGVGARPMHPDWARPLRDQCVEAGVPFLFKQWGEWHTDAYLMSTGAPVFRQFDTFQQWVNKASTWVHGGICLDADGRELRNGGDFMRARDEGKFPVTIMHKTGKKAAGRHLDGVTHDEFPACSNIAARRSRDERI